jgi:putative heme-binding domain-containing protein
MYLQDILQPNASLSAGYETYTVETVNGRVFVGVLPQESPTSITLRQPEGKEKTILRADLHFRKNIDN